MRIKSPELAGNDFKSTFLSCEKDQELIWKKLLVENKPHSDILKKLLIINNKNCLDDSQQQYRKIIQDMSINQMREKGYLRSVPKLPMGEHEEVKSYIILEFDDYVPTYNPEFRDCIILFTIISHLDEWELEDYKIRPQQIAGYIDGILNDTKLSGIGTVQFMGASQIVLNEDLGGMVLKYIATHGSDDYVETQE